MGQYSNLTVNIILFAVVTVIALAMYYIIKYFWIFAERTVQKMHTAYSAKKENG